MAQTTRHSPDLILEEHAFQPETGDAEGAAHLAACSRCQAAVAAMRQERELFQAKHPSVQFIAGLLEREKPRGKIMIIAWSAAAAVLLLGLVVVGWQAYHSSDQTSGNVIRFRGLPGPGLSLFVSRDGGPAVPTTTDSTFAPGDIIRFAVHGSPAGHAHLFHLDRNQVLNSCFPENQGPAVAIQENLQTLLPGSIVLDDELGSESFLLIISPRRLSLSEVQDSLPDSGRVDERLAQVWPGADVRLFTLRKAIP